jgi:Universal stress protein UspA and related nucleotide-binding proteins
VIERDKKIKADLIIVGTHGHQGLNLLLGSQANAILHAATCDVWVIRIK